MAAEDSDSGRIPALVKIARLLPGLPYPSSLLGLFILASCASVSKEGEKVRVTQNSEATRGCTFLQTISVVNTWGPGDSQRKLREEAAKIGADLVFLGADPYTAGGHSAVHYGGEAYRCGSSKGGGPESWLRTLKGEAPVLREGTR